MTTIVINENSDHGKMLMSMIRAARKSTDAVVSIDADDLDRISGLPRTNEECVASLRASMEEYRRTGVVIPMEEMRVKHPRV